MTIGRWLVAYLVVVHLVVAGVATWALWAERAWLIPVEMGLALSVAVGVTLVRRAFGAFKAVEDAPQLLRDGDFMSRLREVGQPELDRLVRVFNEMSDRLREERVRLQEQHNFLAKILAVSPLGILLLDFDGTVSYANPSAERLLQLGPAGWRGKSLKDIGGPLGDAMQNLDPHASVVVPIWGGRRVRCQRGEFLDRGFRRPFLLIEELTEELRQFEKAAYGKLIRTLSHEVNNSVGASNSLLHSCLAYANHLPPEHRRDFEMALSIAIARTDHLNAFMRSFADVIRLPPPVLQPANVEEILDAVRRLFQPQCEERRVEWRIVVEERLPAVMLDRPQMEQVFINLAKNALEAVGTDGWIETRTCRRDGRPSVVVADSGPGPSAEARQNLFTPFFSTKEHGQGIGLTLVQEILNQHRFHYSLDKPEGGPTEFVIVM